MKKTILLTVFMLSSGLSIFAESQVEQQIGDYDKKLSGILWGGPEHPKGKVEEMIGERLRDVYNEIRPLRKSVPQLEEGVQKLKKTVEEYGQLLKRTSALEENAQVLKNQVDMLTTHVTNILDVIKSDKKLAANLGEKEKIATKKI